IIDTDEDMSLAIETSKNISFKDNCVIVDNRNTDFIINSNEDISFTFNDNEDISFTANNNKDIANNKSINPTIDSKEKKDDEVVAVVCNICKQK
ncbi:4041_t:CDS:2, partial [Cetraspora pellucida]